MMISEKSPGTVANSVELIMKSIYRLVVKNWSWLLLMGLFIVVVVFNQIHFSYPDEFENILGGKYFWQGRFPYSGFFTHHNPFAYLLSALIYIFSGESFVRFRLVWGAIQLLAGALYYRAYIKRFSGEHKPLLIVAFIFLAFLATYNWGHMLLADSLAGYLILGAYAWLVGLFIYDQQPRTKDVILISILTSLAVFTTMSQIYAAGVMYLFFTGWYFFKAKKLNILKFGLILLVPYILFGLYLGATRGITGFYEQSIRYNTDYYIQLPDGVSFKNPLRIGIVFAYKFWNSYRVALGMAKDFNLGDPFVPAMALANFVIILYWLSIRRYYLALFSAVMLVFVSTRADPYATHETDYQSLLYHLLSIYHGLLALFSLKSELRQNLDYLKRSIYTFCMFLLGIYFIFLFFMLFGKWFEKSYKKYMGQEALIYDRPTAARQINKLLVDGEKYYIGPFDFENQFYLRHAPVSKYIVTLPGMSMSEKIQSETVSDFIANRPPVVLFNTEMHIYGQKPGVFLLNYLDENYINLAQLEETCASFKINTKWWGEYDVERHLFIENTRVNEILQRLLDQGVINKTDPVLDFPGC
jgi:hypothetical protein